MAICRHIAICMAMALGVTAQPALAQPTTLQVHVPPLSPAADDASALAAKLQNPIGDLISVPFQGNANFNVGPNKGTQEILNIQPVISIHLNEDWNLITRTILHWCGTSLSNLRKACMARVALPTTMERDTDA
jgi:hypothetical protein